jgi:hypothetical protein
MAVASASVFFVAGATAASASLDSASTRPNRSMSVLWSALCFGGTVAPSLLNSGKKIVSSLWWCCLARTRHVTPRHDTQRRSAAHVTECTYIVQHWQEQL